LHLQWEIGGRAVNEVDLRAILHDGRRRTAEEGRETVHAIPLGFTVDATPGVNDPRGMICDMLGARLHMVSAAEASLRNLGACLMRCDLEVEELVSAPFASGLATLVEDEKQLGATVIDMGGGTTSLAVFSEGHLVHTAQIPVGGGQVTNDLATILSTPVAHAERMKTLHGAVHGGADDEREYLPVPLLGEDEHHIARIPRAMVVGIIKPRLEETVEILKDKLDQSGLGKEGGARVVLTGGASQLVGVREMAARILDRQVRLGRPQPRFCGRGRAFDVGRRRRPPCSRYRGRPGENRRCVSSFDSLAEGSRVMPAPSATPANPSCPSLREEEMP
jgi:cell division protein FtsA